jgi:hypothetical protein
MKKVLLVIVIIIVVMSIGVISSADTITLPAFPDGNPDFSNNVYIGVYGNQYQVFSTTGTLIINNSGLYTTEQGSMINCRMYNIVNGNWVKDPGQSIGSTVINNYIYYPTSILYGSTNVYDYKNNTVFFSIPKTPLYLMDNQTLLQPLHQSVIQNIQILLACGVGILSLILSVGLFRKLYQFL